MPRIAGVQTKRNANGAIEKITINAKKHPQAVEALKGMGLIEKSPLQREIEENPEKFITPEELRKDLKQHIRQLWKK